MEKMNLILEFTKQTLYYDTSLDHYEAEQKQPRTISCLKFNNSDLSSQVSIGSLKKKNQLTTLYNHGKVHIYSNSFYTNYTYTVIALSG